MAETSGGAGGSADDDDTATAPAADADSPSRVDGGSRDDGGTDAAAGRTDAGLPDSSRGTGGIPCTRRDTLTGQRKVCVATVGGAELRLADLAEETASPTRLAIYIHGDGARAYESNGAMKAMLGWADAHAARVLAVRAPNGCAWWQAPTHDCATEVEEPDVDGSNAEALAAVLAAVRAGFDIASSPVFYYGSSGGSIFLTKTFYPRYGNVYPGAFAINCGGEVPDPAAYTWDVEDLAARGPSKFWFTYGDRDFLAADEHATAQYFAALGLPTVETVLPDTEHCAFDSHGRALEVFSEYLSAAP